MATAVTVRDNNVPFRSDDRERVLDVYYTHYGTKVFVKNGILTEAIVEPAESLDQEMSELDIQYTTGSTALSLPWFPEGFDLTNNIPDCPLIPSADELKQNLVEHTTKTSKVALPHYNREHQTNYELVEPVTCNGIMREGQLGYHCNFKASETSHDDSSAKLFFAELLIVGHDDSAESNAIYSVTVCCPLEDGESTPCCKFGCRVVLHPKNGC